MKWSLRQKMRLVNGLLVAAVVVALALRWISPRYQMAVMGFSAVLLGGGAALSLKWWECPHCHEHLGRSYRPRFCPHCGTEIDYDAKSEE